MYLHLTGRLGDQRDMLNYCLKGFFKCISPVYVLTAVSHIKLKVVRKGDPPQWGLFLTDSLTTYPKHVLAALSLVLKCLRLSPKTNCLRVGNGKSHHSNGQAVQSQGINVVPTGFVWGICLAPLALQVLQHFLRVKEVLKYPSWNRDAFLSWRLHLFQADLDTLTEMFMGGSALCFLN